MSGKVPNPQASGSPVIYIGTKYRERSTRLLSYRSLLYLKLSATVVEWLTWTKFKLILQGSTGNTCVTAAQRPEDGSSAQDLSTLPMGV